MRSKSIGMLALLTLVAGMVSAVSVPSAQAGMNISFTYASRPADIRVWLEANEAYRCDTNYEDCGYDVYPSVEGVVLNVRTARSCYATVYVVDTAGYIHVVHPLSPWDNTYLRGGRIYSFYLSDFDFGGAFDRGVAYAFAVSSPVRFSYRQYGMGVFAGNLGFQVYGDPYLAARNFYLSIMPASCNLAVVGVSHTRFYVREYVRYPSYLCAGWHDSYGTRRYCRSNCDVYKHYSVHANDPYRALRPIRTTGSVSTGYTDIIRTDKWRDEVRPNTVKSPTVRNDERVAYVNRTNTTKKRTVDHRSIHKSNVVKSSKDSFVQGKKDLSAMRQQLKQRQRSAERVSRKAASKTQVAHAPKKSEKETSDGDGKSKSKGKERHGSR